MPKIAGKNILVTGGAGFIGSHLVDLLLASGTGKVVVIDNFFLGKDVNLTQAKTAPNFVLYRDDAQNLGTMRAIVKKEEIEVIFNLATIALNYSFFNPYGAYMVNVNIAETLLHLLQEEAYKTLVHISSSEAYGTAQYSPMDENHPMSPTTPYAAGKAAADLMIQSFYNVWQYDIAMLRPFNNYGPRQNDGQLAAIIPITAKHILAGERPVIEGTGEQTRDFIHVADTVRAILMAYENEDFRGQIVNLGSGVETPIKELVGHICEFYGYKGEIEYRSGRPADVMRLCASTTLAQNLLGFTPQVSLQQGLAETLTWYNKKCR